MFDEMPMNIPIFFLITSLHLPLFVISPRSLPAPPPPCTRRPDPTSLRPDQTTVIISGYSEHRIPLLHSIAAAYSAAPEVAAVLLLWCNPSTSPRTLANLSSAVSAVLRSPSSSLNYRFYPWPSIRTRSVLICDDDVLPDPTSISFAFSVWRSDPDRLIGFFARSHAYDVASSSWIYSMERDKYSIILTKFMLLHIDHLVSYTCGDDYAAARRTVEEMNNCEDILMNFVAADGSRKGPVMVGARGVRDYGDARNDGVSSEGVKGVGLSSRRGEHMRRRGECIREFHRVLGRMPLRYSYGKVVDDVGEQGLCEKRGRIVRCDHQD